MQAPSPLSPPVFAATDLLFQQDAYQAQLGARVIGVYDGGIVLDQTIFYANSGGQPSDFGEVIRKNGQVLRLQEVRYLDGAKTTILHKLAETHAGEDWIGEEVTLQLDFARRFRLMRMHNALHLLSVVLPYPVTGGSIGEQEGRLDFDISDSGLEKTEITDKINELIQKNANVTHKWISEEALDANPNLVKTMSVKPPRGAGRIRLVEIEGLDLQPCGGTHVKNTAEIGAVIVTAIEKKGKQNRRVRLAFV